MMSIKPKHTKRAEDKPSADSIFPLSTRIIYEICAAVITCALSLCGLQDHLLCYIQMRPGILHHLL